MFREKALSTPTRVSVVAVLLILLSTTVRAVPVSSTPLFLMPAGSGSPTGYEGALDNLRQVFPIYQPPLADPVGLAVDAAGTRAYVIEKGLHRLSWVDIDPTSPNYGSVTAITDALDDPQMAVALNEPETRCYVVENGPGTLKRVTLSSGQVTTVTANLRYPIDLALNHDETIAYVTQFEGALVAVNLSSGSVLTTTTGLESPAGIALSLDETVAYVAEYAEGPLRQVNLSTGAISTLGTGDVRPAYDLAVDTTGGYAYLGEKKSHLVRVNLGSGETETIIQNTGERTEAIALSPDGSTLYGAQRGTGRLLAIDLAAGTAESVFPLLQGPSGVALNQAGTRLYVIEGVSGELSVQDVDPASPAFGALETVATGVVPPDTSISPMPINVAVNAAEAWALVPYEHDLRRVDLGTGAVSTVVNGAFNGVSGVALNSAGTVAYVSHWEGISAVDTSTWAVSWIAETLGGPHLHTLALSPDEAYLYGIRHEWDDYGLPRLVQVRISDGQVTGMSTDVTMPMGLAVTPGGDQAIVSDQARSGRLLAVDLPSGATALLADLAHLLNWPLPGGVALGPDGTIYLASANWLADEFTQAGVIRGIRPGALHRLGVLAEPPLPEVQDLAISADSDRLYLLGGNGLHRVNLSPGSDHGQITPVVDAAIWHPCGVALTSDGYAWVVSDGSLHKVSLTTGALVTATRYQEAAGDSARSGVALSPDETQAYLSTSNGKLVRVELDTGQVHVIASGLVGPQGAAVNETGDTVYVAETDAGRLAAIDLDTGQVTTVTAELETPVDVAFDAPNHAAIVLENPFPSYYISRVDLTSGVVTRVFSATNGSVGGLVLTPDCATAYFAIDDEVWGMDLATGQIVDSLVEGLNRPHGFALAGGGTGAYTTEEFVPRIRHVDLTMGQVSTVLHLPGAASGLVLTQDESTAYVSRMYYDDLLKVDLDQGTWTTVADGCLHGRVVLDPSETTAYVSSYGCDAIWAVNLSDGSRTQVGGDLPAPYALDINAAGTMLYTSVGAVGEQGDFQLLAVELPSGDVTLVATIEESQDAPGDITLSPDERHVYVYDQQGSNIGAGIWRVDVDQASPTYGEVVALGRWIGELQHGEFTADGEHLILAQANGNRILSLYLGEYRGVYLPIVVRAP